MHLHCILLIGALYSVKFNSNRYPQVLIWVLHILKFALLSDS